MGDIRHKIKGFLKNHAAAITAGFLMTAAVAAGLLQAGTTSVSAGTGIGSGGKTGNVSYPTGDCAAYAVGPEISVTPRIYDYGKLLNKGTNVKEDIKTYDDKKKAAAAGKGSSGGWDVHDDPKNYGNKLIYIANDTRRNMVSATISNREDHYSEGSLIFVPVGTEKNSTQKVDNGTDKGVSKKHLIFGSVDDGIEGFIGGITVKGSSASQREYNKAHVIQQKVIGEDAKGIFMGPIHDMEAKNAKKDENKSKLNYKGKDGKIHYYENQASDMLYISEHLDSLLESARNDKGKYKKAVKLFALATNVYKNGGGLYTVPETLEDYASLVTYNSVKEYKEKSNDLKLIRSGNTMHVMKDPYEKIDNEKDMYEHIMSDKKISQTLFKNKYSSDSDSIVAQYIQGEYNMAYLDMLLCGYSVAYHKAGKEATKAWRDAIQTYVGGVNSEKYNKKVVVIKLDVGLMSKTKKGTFYHTSNGTMAKRVFDLGPSVGLTTTSAKLNKRTMVKSFIGVQTKKNADKDLVFNGNDYIKKYQTAINLGNIFSRIKRASKENHKNGKVHTNFSSYTNGIANRLFDMEQSGANVYDSDVKGQAGSEDYIKLLHNGLVGFKGLDSGDPYNYGTYAIISMSWWNNNPPVSNPAKYELRIYSTKAHATKDGAALKDNDKPDTGAIPENETNGRSIHDTAEYAEITATKPGKQQLTDEIHLKVDSLNVDSDFKKLVDKGDAKVTVEYYANKTGDGTEEANAEARAEEKPAVLKNGSDKDSQKYQDTNAEKYCSDKSRYSFKGIDINMKSDPDATGVRVSDAKECYYENGNGVTPDKDKIESTSKYYSKDDLQWDACIGYKNLVWQTGFNEMESKGFTYDVPSDDKKWEHYYRICVVAKVTIRDKKGDYYYKTTDDKPDKDKSVTYTNPVYVTYKISRKVGNPNFEFYGNSGAIDNSESVKAHAYSEFKEGSVYNETFEAMAGVPSTRTMYFATGGEEFMVNLQAVYDDYVAKKGSTVGENGENVDPDAYKAVRKYTVHFNGIDCEYKAGDTMKALGPGQTKTETFVATSSDEKNKHSVIFRKDLNGCEK